METEWNGKDNIVYVWSEGDFDLSSRVTSEFPQKGNPHTGVENCKVCYTDCEVGLKFALSMGCPVVCPGNMWANFGQNTLQNGVNGFVSNNMDELRWIIKRLLEKTPEELKGLSRKAKEKYQELWGENGG